MVVLNEQKYNCENCNYVTSNKSNYNKHISTAKHRNCCFGNKPLVVSSQNSDQEFLCEVCNFNTGKCSNFKSHLSTAKHLRKLNETKTAGENQHGIRCDKCYRYYANYSGLWKHKKLCTKNEQSNDENNSNNNNGIGNNHVGNNGNSNSNSNGNNTSNDVIERLLEFMKINNDLQNTLVEQNHDMKVALVDQKNTLIEQNHAIIEKLTVPTLVQNNINNTTNNQFNLNVFLNEKCKDAMNLTDFIGSMKLQVSDFEETGRLGYVEGITRIFLKFLKEYDVEKRPMHCTDIKRETVYIKHNDVWEKENTDKKYLKWAVSAVAQLNFNQHAEWQKEHPECTKNNSKDNLEFMKLTSVALGGHARNEEDKNLDKIMKNVLKEVVVEKSKKLQDKGQEL
jgi:hypothetical protein